MRAARAGQPRSRVISLQCRQPHTPAPHAPLAACAPLPPTQVAGLKYKVKATVNGGTPVIISAFKPLPHTGNPLDVQGVAAGSEL